ncbi:hypothetical protein PG991_005505 [Apiospora marii]|uniref:Mid2 domain-containing protein n=1 Tax=Apiospora marii TaxID=335849 RepID=A0ABR1S9D3_9PEZI
MKFAVPPEGGLPDLNPDSEVIQRNVPSEGGLPWTVGTSKNIKGSGVFYLELQIQTDDDNVHAGPKCHYFNIVSASTAISGSGNPGPSANASTTTTNSTAVPTALTTKKPLNAESMSINTKIGFGVGIPAAVLVGILMGWMLLRSRRRREITTQPIEASDDGFGIDRDIHSKAELPVTYKRAIKPELPG